MICTALLISFSMTYRKTVVKIVSGFLGILAPSSGIGAQIVPHSVKAGPVTRMWVKRTKSVVWQLMMKLAINLPVLGPIIVVRSEVPNRVFSAAPTRLLRLEKAQITSWRVAHLRITCINCVSLVEKSKYTSQPPSHYPHCWKSATPSRHQSPYFVYISGFNCIFCTGCLFKLY